MCAKVRQKKFSSKLWSEKLLLFLSFDAKPHIISLKIAGTEMKSYLCRRKKIGMLVIF